MPHSVDDWSARHSVLAMAKRTAALVNALGDESTDSGGVYAILRAHGETDLHVSDRDVKEMRAAADELREVFDAEDLDEACELLNGLLREHTGPGRLTSHGGTTPWHLHLDSHDEARLGLWFLASGCMALSVLIWDRQRLPGGICASPTCRNVFLTSGSGPDQRYCSRRCATRERVAAHRARVQTRAQTRQ